jgi:glycosyltransferase involved in cell wall biosynthesis
MRVLIFHGYLLAGTGSNVYNARLAEALVKLGHEVHLFCQDRHPRHQPFVEAAGDWDSGELRVSMFGLTQGDGSRVIGLQGEGSQEDWSEGEGPQEDWSEGEGSQEDWSEGEGSQGDGSQEGGLQGDESQADASPRCTTYRPNLGGMLPVYVQDRYEGIEAKTFAQCSEAEVAAYIQANVDAVREVAELVRPDVALANHLVMGPVILARGLGSKTPYAVKVHGSALEYTVKPQPERFLPFAREGLAQARTVLVGSRHTAKSLWAALGGEFGAQVKRRTRLGPPGVDVERFRMRPPNEAEASARGLIERLRHGAAGADNEHASAFARDEQAAADALERLADGSGPIVAYVGKLIVSKGVDLLIAAWPLVLDSAPDARLAVIGFGAYREGLERLIARLASGDLEGAREIARAGRALEVSGEDSPGAGTSGEDVPLRHLLAFLDSLSDAEADAYRLAARTIGERIVLTGRLDHDELADVLPACEALVVPSTFPEAFGMVAVEAAACGVLPISAAHSGLAEVSEVIAGEVPERAAAWLSFTVDDNAVRAIAERVSDWLGADRALKEQTRAALVSLARERWSWEGVARGVIAAALGESDQTECESESFLR